MDEQVDEQPTGPVRDNAYIAKVLAQVAGLLEFRNENAFKVRSYSMAAETISGMAKPVVEIASQGGADELQKIPGIGKSISAQIIEIIGSGTSPYLESLKQETPVTVLDLRRVSGIGLKTAQLLYKDFGIKNLEELRKFAAGGGLTSVPGLGQKTADRIARSLTRLESGQR